MLNWPLWADSCIFIQEKPTLGYIECQRLLTRRHILVEYVDFMVLASHTQPTHSLPGTSGGLATEK